MNTIKITEAELNIARELIYENQKASGIFLEKNMFIPFSRAAAILFALEKEGSIGPQIKTWPREIYINKDKYD